jgi:hypothetical protein
MLYRLGRVLQVVGMILLPIGLAGNIADPDRISPKTIYLFTGAGIVLFALGWFLQESSRSK